MDPATGKVVVKKEEWADYKVHVSSLNTFPTAAGLASSAAGYAALVSCLAEVFNAKEVRACEATVPHKHLLLTPFPKNVSRTRGSCLPLRGRAAARRAGACTAASWPGGPALGSLTPPTPSRSR